MVACLLEILSEMITYHRIPHDALVDNHMRAPWVMDRIQAKQGEEVVGYVKVAYIPYSRIRQFEEEPLLFVHMLGNEYGLYKQKEGIAIWPNDEENWYQNYLPDIEKQASFVHSKILRKWSQHPDVFLKEQQELQQKSTDELRRYMEDNRAKIWKWVKKRYGSLMQYHFARPDIDYIYVKEEYRRQGIGTQFYIKASEWMNEKNMVLHGSSLQQPKAESAWNALVERGMAEVVTYPPEKGEVRQRHRFIHNVPEWLLVNEVITKVPTPPKPVKSIKKPSLLVRA